MTASGGNPPVHRIDLEGQERVEMVGSPNRPATTALCAFQPAGIDVKRS
jgi:hypothetical protein